MINEKQIQYLLTVAGERNITSAAKKLYISQPALSRMILDLEHSLGAALFIRDRGNLQPTQAGEVYLAGCREVLAISRSVSKKISDLSHSRTGKIRLGTTALTGEFLLPQIIDSFENAFPHVELILMEGKMSVLQHLVKSGKADLALVYQTTAEELDYHLVLENPVYIQVPPTFAHSHKGWKPGIHNSAIAPDVLSDSPLILLNKGRGMREIADRVMEHFSITPGKIIETENIHLANRLAAADKGFTFIPGIALHPFMHNNDQEFYCSIENYPLSRNLYCCYRKNSYLTEAERYLVENIPQLFS